MLTKEEGRLVWKDAALNSVSNDELAKPGKVQWTQCSEGPRTRPGTSARASAFGDEVSRTWTCKEIVGPSAELRRIMATLRMMARTDSAILVFGEKGTGKEIIARSLHFLSHYSHFPFVHVNCELARPEEILAALTVRSAERNRRSQAPYGRFHLGAGKTVFLEGISKLSSEGQDAVLQTLQSEDWELQQTSSLLPRRIRLIASSDVDLLEATRMGGFSGELYQQLDLLSIRIPALRERMEDMPMLVHSFLDLYAQRRGEEIRSLSMKAVELLQLYPWPGNLRELWHLLDRFVVLREADELSNSREGTSGDEPLQWPPLPAGPEEAEIRDCELIITALLQTLSLRSQER